MCDLARPCGGVLYDFLVGPTWRIRHCLNGHSFREGSPAPAWAKPPGRGSHVVHDFARVSKIRAQPEEKR